MTRYRLWQEARRLCPTITTSAVYGFLGGSREIGLEYAEALMGSVGLRVAGPGKAGKPRRHKVKA
jgi:hypothetical protein